jgi:hypothetical protein
MLPPTTNPVTTSNSNNNSAMMGINATIQTLTSNVNAVLTVLHNLLYTM